MRINEITQAVATRAGIYPVYQNESGVLSVYLMIPSDPEYGGSSPQLAKGRVDPGEDVKTSAVREGEEELGLKQSNIQNVELLTRDQLRGLKDKYTMAIFYTEVNDPNDFGNYHYETGWAGWLTIDEAIAKGRKSQTKYLQMLKAKFQ